MFNELKSFFEEKEKGVFENANRRHNNTKIVSQE
jgi:hypothetical protein